jgi:hypothetical protein
MWTIYWRKRRDMGKRRLNGFIGKNVRNISFLLSSGNFILVTEHWKCIHAKIWTLQGRLIPLIAQNIQEDWVIFDIDFDRLREISLSERSRQWYRKVGRTLIRACLPLFWMVFAVKAWIISQMGVASNSESIFPTPQKEPKTSRGLKRFKWWMGIVQVIKNEAHVNHE